MVGGLGPVSMAQETQKKTLRYFQCRDSLWDTFERLSKELSCSTDYLINEAMRQYLRARQQSASQQNLPAQPGPEWSPDAAHGAHMPSSAPGAGVQGAGRGRIPSVMGRMQSVPSLPAIGAAPRPMYNTPPPPPGASFPYASQGLAGAAGGFPARTHSMATPVPVIGGHPGPGGSRPPYLSNAPPPLPRGPQPMGNAPMQQPRGSHLSVIFNGQKIPINKPEFIIGRSLKNADLAIKDSNISRRHSVIVLEEQGYVIRDLGSTNGMEFQGQRIEAKVLEEGDVIKLCDFELTFTYS